MSAEEFFKKATSHDLKPTIVNQDSNFVVVTYWWGRGNLNKNTQRPCPEDRDDLIKWDGIKEYMLKDLRKKNPSATEADLDPAEIQAELKATVKAYKMKWKNPDKYEKMIGVWIDACKKQKCNYLAEEYAEFAVKGGYQHAINFKPFFINLALKASYPRGVLYIDGDMVIKKYPAICDIKEVDYMARGWNSDPRVAPWGEPCFDPYTFETSGGTMFFGNTYYGRALLSYWEKGVLKYPGKADDRILAFVIMKNNLLANLSSIQLPMEYLWMTLDYDIIFKKYPNDVNARGVSITHPECLTGEERAENDSASDTSRMPNGYIRAVESKIKCRSEEVLYEYIHFDSLKNIGNFKYYLDWLQNHKVITVVSYSKKYGTHNAVANENVKLLESINLRIYDNVVLISENKIDSTSAHQVSSSREIIPTVLKYLMNGQHVVYVPKSTRSIRTVLGKANEEHLDLVTKNITESTNKIKKDYTLGLDPNYPIYFGPNNKVLKHLLLMSSSPQEMQDIFNESYMFLTRIHCGWL
jgi:hypothetical protein